MAAKKHPDNITAREVLRLTAAGLTRTEIARALGISRQAVHYHLTRTAAS